MSDEELIESLRLWNRDDAADRIEQLVREAVLSKAAYEGVSSLLLSVQQDCIKEHQRVERLKTALLSLPTVYAHQINTGVREVYDPLQRFYRMEDVLSALKGYDHE